MKRLLLTPLLVLSTAMLAQAQDLKQYLHIRRANGIVESVGVPALETLIGTRVFEVQGVVKGVVRAGSKMSLLLERTDGETQCIDATSVPDWAVASDAPARLIVRATRSEENDDIQASLIAIAREEEVQPIEAALIASTAKAVKVRRNKTAAPSRHGNVSRYVPDGNLPAPVWVLPTDLATPYYAAYVHKRNPKLSNTEAYRIAAGILWYSRQYGVPAQLIVAMVVCESDFNPNEVSRAGAMGLGQLMPDTVQDYGITNPFDSVQNLKGTIREIRSHLDKYRAETGDEFRTLVLGLAAYNAGEGAVRRHGGVPPYRETESYIRKVISLYSQLRRKPNN